jgi:quercetin dioxygenase-like cupin family protein
MKYIKPEEKEWEDKEAYSKKILFTEDDLKSRGNIVQVVKFLARSSVKPHYHKQTKEIFYILKEGGIIFIDNKQFRAKNWETLLCEPGEIHAMINDTDEEFRILVFKINAKENDFFDKSES